MRVRADDRRDRGQDAADLLGVDTDLARGSQVQQVRDRGASIAASAAMRTSTSVSASRLDASIESAVMLASRSDTGVSLVDPAMVTPFFNRPLSRRIWCQPLPTVITPIIRAGATALVMPMA